MHMLLVALQAPAAPQPAPIVPMTPIGWLFLIASVGSVVFLVLWCFYRVLTAPPDDHVVKPPDALGG
ncbi:MAG: hypothetical protein FJ299_10960 [Planctomycetes bacterium]|nr:hypothetical protein [Planctomycetota bacterium]